MRTAGPQLPRAQCSNRRTVGAGVALATICLAVFLGGCGSAEPPNVILITLDTLRADHLGCYGYFRDTTPSIDAFAADGILFERAVSVAGTTLPAHVSLWTSTYPSRHGVFSNHYAFDSGSGDEPLLTVAQMFSRAGYATAGFASSGGWKEETGLHVGFDTFRWPDGPWQIAEVTTSQVRSWLESEPSEEPFFLWVHYFDPHFTYEAPEPFAGMYEVEPELHRHILETRVPPGQRPAALRQNNLYDAEIRYMDSQLGVLFESFEAEDLYEDSLIILAGDHGEGMMQHDVLQHGVIYNEQLWVPLIIKFPAGSGPPPGRHGGLVSLIDVLPTVTAQLDLPLPVEQFDGIDVLSQPRRSALAERERTRRFDDLSMALLSERWKYVLNTGGPDELFDLRADPWETHDVIARHPRVAERLRAELIGLVRDSRRRNTRGDSGPDASEELGETLRALGYVE